MFSYLNCNFLADELTVGKQRLSMYLYLSSVEGGGGGGGIYSNISNH